MTTKSLEPDYEKAFHNKGLSLFELGKYNDAIKCYDKILKIKPNDAEAFKLKGLSLYHLGKYNDAIKCFDKALKGYPKERWNLNFIIKRQIKRGGEDVSDPLISLHVHRAFAPKRRDERQRYAIKTYKSAIRLNPKLKSSRLEKLLHSKNPFIFSHFP